MSQLGVCPGGGVKGKKGSRCTQVRNQGAKITESQKGKTGKQGSGARAGGKCFTHRLKIILFSRQMIEDFNCVFIFIIALMASALTGQGEGSRQWHLSRVAAA